MKARPDIVLPACLLLSAAGASAQAQVAIAAGMAGSVFGYGPTTIGSPYCATQQSENVQTLGDGTHVPHKSKNQICRDSLGRTRTENFAADERGDVSQNPTAVNIFDPVEHVQYMLDVNRHTARRIALPVSQPLSPKVSNLPKSPTPNPSAAREVLRPQTTIEHLETQVIEGVLADGTRITTTYPAGFQGSDRPIVTVEERWSSQELGTAVLFKRSDPRFGNSVEQLTNINRSEPDPALFRIPADYTVEEVPWR
jgi:hypothetical protein